MNKGMLRAIMLSHGDTNGSLARFIGISESRLSAKINEAGGAEFNQREIIKIGQKYNLTTDEVEIIFFNELVS